MLLLFALIAGVSGSWAQDVTYKLTKVTSVTAGEKYVFEQDGHVMKNTVSNNALQTAATYNSKGLSGTESYIWTLEAVSDGFYMKNVSLSSNSYLNNSSSTNVSLGSKSSVWAFNFQDDGTVLIQNTKNSNRFLGYSSSTSYAYKAYAISNVESYSHAINVYKLEEESTGGETSTVAVPSFSPAAGAVTAGTAVSLTQADAEIIMYTTDGTDPSYTNNNGIIYSEPITITKPVTIKAIAIDADENESNIASAAYTIIVTAPIFSLPAGEVNQGEELTMSATTGHTIIYTTDGTDPSKENGNEYAAPIIINDAMTVKAIAVDAYDNESAVTSATYTVKIAGAIDIIPNYSFFGLTAATSGTEKNEVEGTTSEGVTVTYTRNDGSLYLNNNAMRFYKSNTLKIEAPEGKVITTIVLTMSNEQTDLTSDPSGYDNNTKTWTGSASAVTLSRPSSVSGYAQITKITVVLADDVVDPNKCQAPTLTAETTFLGSMEVTISSEEEGAVCYYTLDGTDPTRESTKYTEPFTITETTTVKAIATIGDDKTSSVVSATYTAASYSENIAAFKNTTGEGYLKMTGAQVVFIDADNKNIYVRDASGAIDIFSSTGFTKELKTGDILDGYLSGTYSPYKGLPEIKDAKLDLVTVTGNETVVAKVIDGTTEAIGANLCDLVKIENTEITETSSKYYVGDNSDIQLYDNFHVGYTVTTGQPVDVSGIATIYNTTYELFPRYETDIVYLDNSEEVSVPAKGYITFCSENALDFSSTDAITVYTAKVVGGKVVMTQIKKVPAETGVILMNASGLGSAVEATNVPFLSEDADDVSDNELVGVLENTSLDYSVGGKFNYVLQQQEGDSEPHFYKAVSGTLRAKRAYLSTTYNVNSAGAPALSIDWGEGTTGINSVERGALSVEGCYTLDGRRVAQLTKGLYIVNGRKVIIK